MTLRLQVIDSHTGGEPTRCVVAGGPPLKGATIAEKRASLAGEFDHLRQGTVCEPRGSDIVVGAWLTEPCDPDCVAGVVFYNNVGVLNMCGHGTIGVAETLRHMGKITSGRHALETPVGKVWFDLLDDGRVRFENVPSYRLRARVSVAANAKTCTGDVAWGGNWFFLCDDHGESLELGHAGHLVDICKGISEALVDQGIRGESGAVIDHIELVGPSPSGADARNFVLCPGGAYDRSPCGTGTSAKVACLAADGKLAPCQVWRQESITGSLFEASYRLLDDRVVPAVTGSAHVTGESTLIFDESDPLRWGFTSEARR